MNIVFSDQALAELEQILAYIALNNPSAARRVRDRIMGSIGRVARHPYSAQEVKQRPGVRRLPLVRYPYSVYYEIIEGEVVILRVIHDARQPPFSAE